MAKKTKKNLIKKPRLKLNKKNTIISIIVVTCILIATWGVYMGVKIYQETDGLSVDKLITDEPTVMLDSDGKQYNKIGNNGITNTNITYDELPQVLIDAVVSAEDSRYFEHDGFDLPRIVKAFMGNLAAGRITGGGSTITQQLIKKSYYPNAERTIERKVGEVLLSIEATKKLTKERILELYLNKIYFGNSSKAVGVAAASKYYFGKSVQNLTLPEAALLAGAINSPANYDPYSNLTSATKRRNTILDLMYTHGYITEEERDTAKNVKVENMLKYDPDESGTAYQAYSDMVVREVEEETGLDPYETGMRIYTYMDRDLQETLDDIASGKTHTYYDDYVDVGACVQETQHGRVIGVISGRNYTALGTTNAYAADKETAASDNTKNYGQRHQPGSSLKPILAYASAFEYLNYSTAHYVHDVPYSDGDWTPKNWDNKYHGDVSIKEALYQSWNLAAIQTLKEVIDEVGTDKMTSYLEGFGYDMYDETLTLGYAIGGWSSGVTCEEQAAAYATISNGGTYYEPHTVEKIEIIATGEVIYIDKEAENNKTRAISEESAFMIRSIMTEYVSESLGQYGVFNIGYQIGAKSGTTNHGSDAVNQSLVGKSKDSWMVGYSPDYSWAVWCGYSSEAQKKGYYMKGKDAREIAVQIAKAVHTSDLKNTYHQPSGVVQAKCVTGIYPYVSPGSGVPSSRITTGWFKKGYTPTSSVSGSGISSLSSFEATVENNQIKVTFSKYPSSGSTTKKYTVNGKTYTLPYYGDSSQIYGSATYKVEVTDSTGATVHTQTLSSNTGTLSFTPTAGTYTVTGYYASSDGETTSNKISKTVQVAASFGGSFKIGTTTDSSIAVSVTVPTGNTVSVSLYDSSGNALKSQSVTGNQTVTFSGLTAGSSYTIKASETTSDNQTKDLGSKSAKTTGTSDTTNQTNQ